MGFYKHVMPCGCIQITTTLTVPPITYYQSKCDQHVHITSESENTKPYKVSMSEKKKESIQSE
jgi:hypothetical protein